MLTKATPGEYTLLDWVSVNMEGVCIDYSDALYGHPRLDLVSANMGGVCIP